MLALLAIVLFNSWQVASLRREVADLREHVGSGSSESASLSVLDKARKHADQAKEYMAKGDLKRAKSELDESVGLMQQAGRNAGESYKDKIEKTQKTLDDTRSGIERLIKKFEKQPDKSKGG